MKVIDLIISLQNLNPNLEVTIDATPSTADVFKLININECEEIETNNNEKYCLLSHGEYREELNGN